MLIKREKYYKKKINKSGTWYYELQRRKRTSFWLFGIIPLYIKDEYISGDFEMR